MNCQLLLYKLRLIDITLGFNVNIGKLSQPNLCLQTNPENIGYINLVALPNKHGGTRNNLIGDGI